MATRYSTNRGGGKFVTNGNYVRGIHIDNRKEWFSIEDLDMLRLHGFMPTGSVRNSTIISWKWLFLDTEIYRIWNAGNGIDDNIAKRTSSSNELKEFLHNTRGKRLEKDLNI